jgi:hypothetical protein
VLTLDLLLLDLSDLRSYQNVKKLCSIAVLLDFEAMFLESLSTVSDTGREVVITGSLPFRDHTLLIIIFVHLVRSEWLLAELSWGSASSAAFSSQSELDILIPR